MIQAIIDIGSNTVRMAIYEIKGSNIDFIHKKKHMLGLASYLDNNVMTREGIDKLCVILEEFKDFLNIFSIENVVAFATAALRNCVNSKDAVAEISRCTGIDIRILSGDKEAEYDFVGATRNIDMPQGMLVDIGGGSTELVYYQDGEIKEKISLHIGSLGLKREFCKSVLPNKDEVDKMYKKAEDVLGLATGFSGIKCMVICGIGGTFKGTTALYNALYTKDRQNKAVSSGKIEEMIRRFGSTGKLSQNEAVILMKNIPDRINTIISGMVIADVIVKKFGVNKVIYSDSGVREGFIYSEIIK